MTKVNSVLFQVSCHIRTKASLASIMIADGRRSVKYRRLRHIFTYIISGKHTSAVVTVDDEAKSCGRGGTFEVRTVSQYESNIPRQYWKRSVGFGVTGVFFQVVDKNATIGLNWGDIRFLFLGSVQFLCD